MNQVHNNMIAENQEQSAWLQGFLASEALERDKISVKRIYVDICDGSIHEALVLSQIIYWHLPNKETGKTRLRVVKNGSLWLVKKSTDWWQECRVKERTARKCLDSLRKKGIIETQLFKFNGAPTNHIKLCWNALESWIRHHMSNGIDTTCQMELTSDVNSLTEITNRNYNSETTQDLKEDHKHIQNVLKVQADSLNQNQKPQNSEAFNPIPSSSEAQSTGLSTAKDNSMPRRDSAESVREMPKSPFDEYGCWRIPMQGKAYYPGKWTIRTMQLLIWSRCYDDADYWANNEGGFLIDYEGDELSESEFFESFPMGKVKFFNSLEYKTEIDFDIDWFNQTAKHFFEYWSLQFEDNDAKFVENQITPLLSWLHHNSETFQVIWKEKREAA